MQTACFHRSYSEYVDRFALDSIGSTRKKDKMDIELSEWYSKHKESHDS